MITWDEDKRAKNLKKHGIDLADCEPIFDEPMITREDTSEAYGEQRSQSLGLLNGQVVFAVWADRPAGAHMISVRDAERHERKYYYANIQF